MSPKKRSPKAVAKSLNEFLEYMTSKEVGGGVCLREKVRVYAPTCWNPETKVHECMPAVEKLRVRLSNLYGGSTSWLAQGAWWDEEHKVAVDEPSMVIESAHQPLCSRDVKKFVQAVQTYAREAHQLGISIENQYADFYMGKGRLFTKTLRRKNAQTPNLKRYR